MQENEPNQFESIIIDIFKRVLSCCLLILGRRDTGKTDLSLRIIEILKHYNIINNFATNIHIYEAPFEILYITNLQDLEFWCKNTQGKKLFILDEAGKSLRRRTPMSGLNIQLLDNLQILRKYKLSMILITPHEKYIDSASLGSDVLDAIIVKPEFKNRKIALFQDLMEEKEIFFTNLPRTQLKFNTFDVAPFKKDAPTSKPQFKDHDLSILWEWSHGKSIKDLGVHAMIINRLTRKFVKEVMERESHVSHNKAIEDTSNDNLVKLPQN